jgi:hypothetical protein
MASPLRRPAMRGTCCMIVMAQDGRVGERWPFFSQSRQGSSRVTAVTRIDAKSRVHRVYFRISCFLLRLFHPNFYLSSSKINQNQTAIIRIFLYGLFPSRPRPRLTGDWPVHSRAPARLTAQSTRSAEQRRIQRDQPLWIAFLSTDLSPVNYSDDPFV